MATRDDEMAAVVRTIDGPALVRRAAPRPEPGWVRLRVELAGVCRTDVAAATGQLAVPPGRVLGHEMVGVVDVVGAGVDDAVIGTRASIDPRLAEGVFLGVQADGAFAERVVVPATTLVPVPTGLAARRAAFVEPLAAALAVRRVSWPRGARIGVTGGGRIAELTARVLAADGAVVVRVNDGAHVIEAGPLHALVHTAAGGLPSLSSLPRGAVVVVKSRPVCTVPVDLRAVTERELSLVGAAWGDFADAVALLSAGAFAVDDLLGPVWPLSSYARAFAASEDQKVFLAPG